VLQSSSPSYVLMASLDAARQQVQQLQLGHHDDDESFVVRGMRLATEARRLLNQLPPLRVLDGATLTLHPPPVSPLVPVHSWLHQDGRFSSACRASWALSGYARFPAEWDPPRSTRGEWCSLCYAPTSSGAVRVRIDPQRF